MQRPNSMRARGWPVSWWLWGAFLIGGGCATVPLTRSVNPEDPDRDRYGVATVFQRASVGNAEAIPVGGVGLVIGLDGTGGNPPADENRAKLEDDLRRRNVRDIKKLLNSTDVALVLVSGVVKPGARKGDPLDLEVHIPRGNPATSLRGGELQECLLYNYGNSQSLAPGHSGPGGQLIGHALVTAQGSILVGLGEGDEATKAKSGRIWGGGRSRIDLPFNLVLNSEQQFASVAKLLADRINHAYLGQSRTAPGISVAVPMADPGSASVSLNIPPQYRLNQPRFLRVTGLVPLRDPGASGLEASPDRPQSYRQRLLDDLRDPGRCVVAALRLEALGTESVPDIKAVLKDATHPLVKFCCAEALAYLGSTAGADDLADAVRKQPVLRSFALTALAALDEAICQERLIELVKEGGDDETRYGAFRALGTLNPRHPLVRGELLAESFALHAVPHGSRPMVHLTTVRKAEVVLFDEPTLQSPFSIASGDFVLSATNGDDRCIISLIQPGADMPTRKPCSLKLLDILKTMGQLGANYADVVDLLQQAHRQQALVGALRVDALPQGSSVEELARIGRQGGLSEEATLQGKIDPSSTPNLFEGSPRTLRDRQK